MKSSNRGGPARRASVLLGATVAVVAIVAGDAYAASNHGKVGGTVTVKGQTNDLVAVTIGKIEDPLLAYGADAGMRVIGIEFTIKNVGKTKYDDSPGAFVSTADGEISGGLITGSGPCNTPSDLKLTSGQEKTFCIPFEIQKGSKLAFIQYDTDSGYGTPAVFAVK